MLIRTLNTVTFTCDVNVGTYYGMSIPLLQLQVNTPLSIIILPIFHRNLSPGASSCTVHQFLADSDHQGFEPYSTTGPSSADNMLIFFMFFSFFVW
jgi:hypothetical protein